MSWQDVALVAVGAFQVVALAWIAAWQQRAAREVRKLNGAVETELRAIARTALPRSTTAGDASSDQATS